MQITMPAKEPTRFRIPLLLLSIIFSFYHCRAQETITFEHNAPRDGDRLHKIQVDVISHGERGRDAVWEVMKTDDGKDYTQEFFTKGDSMVCREHATNYYYTKCGDSLLLRGFRNRMTTMDYVKPAIHRTGTMTYGDSISSEIMARGRYCDRLNIGMWGQTSVLSDATGTIINGEDTLRNILRLHQRTNFRRISCTENLPDTLFTDTYLRQCIDSLPYDNVCEDRYIWYKAGHRYPVMETVVTSHIMNDSIHSGAATSFLYLPEEQRADLNTDLANEKVQEQLQIRGNSLSGRRTRNGSGNAANEDPNGRSLDTFPVTADASLNADGSLLLLDYTMKEEGELSLGIYTDGGAMLAQRNFGKRPAGAYSEIIHLAKAIKSGNALINIVFGDKNKVIKINKDGTL